MIRGFRRLSVRQLLLFHLLFFGDGFVFGGRHTVTGPEASVEGGTGVEPRLVFHLIDVQIEIAGQQGSCTAQTVAIDKLIDGGAVGIFAHGFGKVNGVRAESFGQKLRDRKSVV